MDPQRAGHGGQTTSAADGVPGPGGGGQGRRTHQKRDVQTSTAQLLLCIAAVDAAAAEVGEEKARRSAGSSSSAARRESARGGREELGLRVPDAMAGAGEGSCGAAGVGKLLCWLGSGGRRRTGGGSSPGLGGWADRQRAGLKKAREVVGLHGQGPIEEEKLVRLGCLSSSAEYGPEEGP